MSTLDASTGLTCVACRLVFKTADVQREHYRTDWHRYNLKRQVAELPPVTDEQFRDKVLSYKAQTETQAKEDNSPLYCACCKKQIKSRAAYEDHILSKKHKEKENDESLPKKGPKQPRKKTSNLPQNSVVDEPKEEEMESEEDDDSSDWETDHGSDDEEKELDYNEADALPATSCLFCPQTKNSIADSLEHMRFHHGFGIPDKNYLVDEEGLLKYLGLKVGAGRCCIYCPDVRSRFATVAACQTHMRDKEHCKIDRKPERMLEFAEFYDYSPMYEEGNDSSSDVLYDDGWTLTLPSGAKIGHRSLMLFYRQYLKPVDAVKRDAAKAAIERARGLIPALAWTNTTGPMAKQAARDMKFVDRYRRRFDVRWRTGRKLFKTQGRVGDN